MWQGGRRPSGAARRVAPLCAASIAYVGKDVLAVAPGHFTLKHDLASSPPNGGSSSRGSSSRGSSSRGDSGVDEEEDGEGEAGAADASGGPSPGAAKEETIDGSDAKHARRKAPLRLWKLPGRGASGRAYGGGDLVEVTGRYAGLSAATPAAPRPRAGTAAAIAAAAAEEAAAKKTKAVPSLAKLAGGAGIVEASASGRIRIWRLPHPDCQG